MSLLADLLSKVKHSTSKGEIPPNLKNIVHTSVKRSAYKRKVIFISVFLAVSVMSGILIVYYMRNLTGHDLTGIPDKKVDMRGNKQAEITPEVGKQIQTERKGVPSGEKSKEDKTVLQKNSVKKTEVEEIKETVKVEKSQQPLHPVPQEVTPVNPWSGVRTQIDRPDTFEKDAYLYAARDYELKKDYSKALSLYKKVLEIDRDNVTVMNNIAYILLQLGLVEESIKYSQKAVDINKDYVPALINLGVGHTKLGDITAAGEYLKRASILEPDNQSIIFNLAIFYEKQKDYDTASEYYIKLIHLGSVEGFLGLARVYEKKGSIEEALKIYKSIYSLDSIDDKTRILVDQRVNILNEKLRMGTALGH